MADLIIPQSGNRQERYTNKLVSKKELAFDLGFSKTRQLTQAAIKRNLLENYRALTNQTISDQDFINCKYLTPALANYLYNKL